MSAIQTNILRGKRVINSGEALAAYEGHLVVLADAGSEPEVLLPTNLHDLCLYLVETGGALDEDSTVIPLEHGQEVRLIAKGSGSAGDTLILADPGTPADKGKVRAITALAYSAFSPGVALEDFEDGQYVLVKVHPKLSGWTTVAAGIHPWAGGAATTDSIAVVGLLATDVVIASLVARNSTELLNLALNDAANDQIDLTLSANGTDATTQIAWQVLRQL